MAAVIVMVATDFVGAASLGWTKITPPADVPAVTYLVYVAPTATGAFVEYDVGDVDVFDMGDAATFPLGVEYEAYVRASCVVCDPVRTSTDSNHLVFTLSAPPQVIHILSPPTSVTFQLP